MLEAQTREEGKPEQAIGQDRRREAQRVLQDGRAARAAVRQGPEDDDPRRSSKVSAANAAGPPLRPRQDRRGVARGPSTSAEEESLMPTSRYRRVVLKLSGEAFADKRIGFGIDAEIVLRIAQEVIDARRDLGVEIAIVVGGGNIFRGMTGENAWHGPGPRRLHGDARNRHQRIGVAGRARVARPTHPRADRDQHGAGRRALHPAARDPPPREGPARDLRGRERQPVLHDRHDGRAPGRRDPGRSPAQGDPLGCRRRLQRRSSARPRRGQARTPQPLRGAVHAACR